MNRTVTAPGAVTTVPGAPAANRADVVLRTWKILSAMLVFLVATSAASGQPASSYTFELVEPVQTYPYYADPRQIAINDNGDVAYGTPSGIHVWDGTTHRFVGAGILGGLNNAGEVVYLAPDSRAVYLWTPVGTVVVASGWVYSDAHVNNHGPVAFRAFGGNEIGIFKWVGGVITPLARVLDVTRPGGEALQRIDTSIGFNDDGFVTFKGALATGVQGLFLTDGTGPLTMLLAPHHPALPDVNHYQAFHGPTINNRGDVLVWARSWDWVSGALLIPFGAPPIWQFVDSPGTAELIAGKVTLNDVPRILFEPFGQRELMISDGPSIGPTGQPVTLAGRLIGAGDSVAGLTVSSVDIGFYGRRINQAGDFVFQATLTDGVYTYDAIVRARLPRTQATTPTAPTNLRASVVNSHEVFLEWADNSVAPNNEDRFELWLSNDGVSFSYLRTGAPDRPLYWDTSQLPNGFAGTSRHYKVQACNNNTCSAFSNIATPQAPPPPLPRLNLTLTPVAGQTSSVRLEWMNPDMDADFVQIVRSGRYHDRTPADRGFYLDSRLTPGATYCYEIRGVNYGGVSDRSNIACIVAPTPLTLSGVQVAAVLREATITFTTNLPASGSVQFSPDACRPLCAFREIVGTRGTSHTFTLTDLVPGTEYLYFARAAIDGVVVDVVGRFTTAPFRILNPRVTATDFTTAVITWETNVPAVVEAGGLPSTARYDLQTGAGQVTFTLVISGLTPGTAHTLVLSAQSFLGPRATATVQFTTTSPEGSLVARLARKPRIGPVAGVYRTPDATGALRRVRIRALTFEVTLTNISSDRLFDNVALAEATVDLPCPPASGLCYETFLTYPRIVRPELSEFGRALIAPQTVGSLAPGEESAPVLVTFYVDDYVLAGLQGLFRNGGVLHLDAAAIARTGSGPVTFQDVLDVRVALAPMADLGLRMTDVPHLSLGHIRYRLEVYNRGPLPGVGVHVKFGLPPRTRLDAPGRGRRRQVSTNWVCRENEAGTMVDCDFRAGQMPVQTNGTNVWPLEIAVAFDRITGPPIIAVASVRGRSEDPNVDNDTVVAIASLETSSARSDLKLQVSAPPIVRAGEEFEVEARVSNAGPDAAANVVVQFSIQSGEFVRVARGPFECQADVSGPPLPAEDGGFPLTPWVTCQLGTVDVTVDPTSGEPTGVAVALVFRAPQSLDGLGRSALVVTRSAGIDGTPGDAWALFAIEPE